MAPEQPKQAHQPEKVIPLMELQKTPSEVKAELKDQQEQAVVDFVNMLGSGQDIHSIADIHLMRQDLEPEALALFEDRLDTEIGVKQSEFVLALKNKQSIGKPLLKLLTLYGAEECFRKGVKEQTKSLMDLSRELEETFRTDTDFNFAKGKIGEWDAKLGLNMNWADSGPEAVAAMERAIGKSGFLEIFAKQELDKDESFVGVKGGWKF